VNAGATIAPTSRFVLTVDPGVALEPVGGGSEADAEAQPRIDAARAVLPGFECSDQRQAT
jgi:hypothetical protein